jgi:hypothetical protein
MKTLVKLEELNLSFEDLILDAESVVALSQLLNLDLAAEIKIERLELKLNGLSVCLHGDSASHVTE